MTAICMVRHGETDWNAAGRIQGSTDIPLNDKGRRQAKEAGHFLKKEKWDLVIASPLSRAMETAKIICSEMHEEKILTMDCFAERGFGEAEGLTKEERAERFPDGHFPGAEPYEGFRERVMEGIDEIRRKYPSQKILLIAHGAVIKAILTSIGGEGIDTDSVLLMNACISNLQFIEEQWEIQNYNEISHLTME